MEDKYKEFLSELLYQISKDVDNLKYEDDEDILEAIGALSIKLERLSDDIIFEDEIVYKRSGKDDIRFSLV